MFGKKTNKEPLPVPKPLPKASPKQIEPIEAEEVPEEGYLDEDVEEVEEFGDSGEPEESNEELTEATVVAYLKNHEQRLQKLESAFFRIKESI